MKLENGIEKLAELLGLKVGQKFIIGGTSQPDVALYNPYEITASGILDRDGDAIHPNTLTAILNGQLAYEPIDKPLLTEEEKTCLTALNTICGNIDTITVVDENVGRTVMYCVDDCEVSVAEVVVAPGLFDELERNRKYTWEELGLED